MMIEFSGNKLDQSSRCHATMTIQTVELLRNVPIVPLALVI